MKFDFAIGNPPYQETQEGTSDNPIYNCFMDAAYGIAEKVELITPARFLFKAGKTPKTWNEKMLEDEHLKVSYYEQDSSKVFSNTDIKGGIAVTYRDKSKIFGAIDTFTQYSALNNILAKVKGKMQGAISDIVYSPESYKFTNLMYEEHPEILEKKININGKEMPLISKGHEKDLTSNIFDKLSQIVFFQDMPDDGEEYVEISGRKKNVRTNMWILKKYIAKHENLDAYKLFFPKANGSGKFGEPISSAIIGLPEVGHTQTFISIGKFETKNEVIALNKYIYGKFARAMLGVLKVTQDNKKMVWKYVPLQDFTNKSDIDWSVSIANIDSQLYKKYGLSEDEISFIEANVKEME